MNGNVAYKFFLGGDNTSDFSVEPGHALAVTFTPTEAGITRQGDWWKVEKNLTAAVPDFSLEFSQSEVLLNDRQPHTFTVIYKENGGIIRGGYGTKWNLNIPSGTESILDVSVSGEQVTYQAKSSLDETLANLSGFHIYGTIQGNNEADFNLSIGPVSICFYDSDSNLPISSCLLGLFKGNTPKGYYLIPPIPKESITLIPYKIFLSTPTMLVDYDVSFIGDTGLDILNSPQLSANKLSNVSLSVIDETNGMNDSAGNYAILNNKSYNVTLSTTLDYSVPVQGQHFTCNLPVTFSPEKVLRLNDIEDNLFHPLAQGEFFYDDPLTRTFLIEGYWYIGGTKRNNAFYTYTSSGDNGPISLNKMQPYEGKFNLQRTALSSTTLTQNFIVNICKQDGTRIESSNCKGVNENPYSNHSFKKKNPSDLYASYSMAKRKIAGSTPEMYYGESTSGSLIVRHYTHPSSNSNNTTFDEQPIASDPYLQSWDVDYSSPYNFELSSDKPSSYFSITGYNASFPANYPQFNLSLYVPIVR